MTTKRYLFSFPERAQQDLDRLYEAGVFPSKGEVVREALHIARSLQEQAAQGYTEVSVRNSQNRERVLVLPHLIGEKSYGDSNIRSDLRARPNKRPDRGRT